MLPHIRYKKAGRRGTGISFAPLLAIAFLSLAINVGALVAPAVAGNLTIDVADGSPPNSVIYQTFGPTSIPPTSCTGVCGPIVLANSEPVQLQPIAGAGWVFYFWDADALGLPTTPDGTINFNMDSFGAPFTAQAKYAPSSQLTINFTGDGSGSVQCSPGDQTFAPGDTLTGSGSLIYGDIDRPTCTPTAHPGSYFVCWNGAGSGTPDRDFVMSVDRVADAQFDALPTISINDVTTTEGDAGTVNYIFRYPQIRTRPYHHLAGG